jgi:hypothetical protein
VELVLFVLGGGAEVARGEDLGGGGDLQFVLGEEPLFFYERELLDGFLFVVVDYRGGARAVYHED